MDLRRLIALYTFFTLWACGNIVYAQSVSTLDLNLNTGGYLTGVAVSKTYKHYYLVGDFSSISGNSRNGFAILDSNNLQLKPDNPITSIDGNILGVAVSEPYIYLSGDFTQVNGVPQVYLTRLEYLGFPFFTYAHSPLPQDSTIGGSPRISPLGYGQDGIHDIMVVGDTLIAAGQFTAITLDESYLQNCLFSYKLNSQFTPIPYPIHNTPGMFPIVHQLLLHQGNIYASGDDLNGSGSLGNLVKFSRDGTQQVFSPYWPNGTHSAAGCTRLEGFSSQGHLAAITPIHLLDQNGLSQFLIKHASGIHHPLSLYGEGAGVDVVNYDDKMLSLNLRDISHGQTDYLFFYEYDSTMSVATSLDSLPVSNLDESFDIFNRRLFLADDLLIISDPTLTNVDGQIHQGLAAICLPPHRPDSFIQGNATPCEGSVESFAIPKVTNAAEYHWECIGGDVFIAGQNISSGGVVLSGPSYHEVDIEFKPGSWATEIKVTPISRCGEARESSSFDIASVLPRPLISPLPDSTLTCARDTIQLTANSITASQYTWYLPDLTSISDSTITLSSDGQYEVAVSDTNGCVNRDTSIISFDTTTPILYLPSPPLTIDCSSDTVQLLASSNEPQANLYWRQLSNGFVSNNPAQTIIPGTWRAVIIDTVNGCMDSAEVVVDLDQEPPEIGLLDHQYTPGIPVDTVTCIKDSVLLSGFSIDPDVVYRWTDTSFIADFGDIIYATSAGEFLLYALDTTNSCEDLLTVRIAEFKNPPPLNLSPTQGFNCSHRDSVILEADSGPITTSISWTGNGIDTLMNPVWVYTSGLYSATATRLDNGCSIRDSLTVPSTAQIEVNAGNDTLVCKGDEVLMSVSYVGHFTNPVYSWSNGETSEFSNYLINSQTVITLTISSDTCTGTDTVVLDIPEPPSRVIQSFSPCGSDSSGQVIITASGSHGPYDYSVDGGLSFQSSSQFTGLTVGTYGIQIRDSLGCRYLDSAVISPDGNSPQPLFLAPTYNTLADTIVMTDVSDPPADSIRWSIPIQFHIIDSSSHEIHLLPSDTGVFSVTLHAHYGGCVGELTKEIHVGEFDTTSATIYNRNGIDEIILYPNPGDGNFTLRVEFFKTQASTVTVQDVNGLRHFYHQQPESLEFEIPIVLSNSLPSGSYPLLLVSEYDAANITLIISR